jgi:hypothetical protein
MIVMFAPANSVSFIKTRPYWRIKLSIELTKLKAEAAMGYCWLLVAVIHHLRNLNRHLNPHL